MIHTTLKQAQRYAATHPLFARAFAELQKRVQEAFAEGRTSLDGERMYLNAFSYETRKLEEGQMEAHRQYIDVMYLFSGKETIAYCPLEKLETVTTPYSESGDALLAAVPAEHTCITMNQGDIAIFFPEDAHCPGLVLGEKQHVEKMVVKVQL